MAMAGRDQFFTPFEAAAGTISAALGPSTGDRLRSVGGFFDPASQLASRFTRGMFGIKPKTSKDAGNLLFDFFGEKYGVGGFATAESAGKQFEALGKIKSPLTKFEGRVGRKLNALEKGEVFGQQQGQRMTSVVFGQPERARGQELQRQAGAAAQGFEGAPGPITDAIQGFGQDVSSAQGIRGLFGMAPASAQAAGVAGLTAQFQTQLLPTLQEIAPHMRHRTSVYGGPSKSRDPFRTRM